MAAQEAPGLASIRHLLERTTKDPEVLRDLLERDLDFAALCREHRQVEVGMHQLRRRRERIEEDLLAKIEASGRSPDEAGSSGERAAPNDIVAIQDDLRRMLVNLIKAGLASTDEAAVDGWRRAAMNVQEELRGRLAALTDEEVDLDVVWNQARREAQGDPLVQSEETMKPVLPPKCLFSLSELAAADFSFLAAAARVRVSTATG